MGYFLPYIRVRYLFPRRPYHFEVTLGCRSLWLQEVGGKKDCRRTGSGCKPSYSSEAGMSVYQWRERDGNIPYLKRMIGVNIIYRVKLRVFTVILNKPKIQQELNTIVIHCNATEIRAPNNIKLF